MTEHRNTFNELCHPTTWCWSSEPECPSYHGSSPQHVHWFLSLPLAWASLTLVNLEHHSFQHSENAPSEFINKNLLSLKVNAIPEALTSCCGRGNEGRHKQWRSTWACKAGFQLTVELYWGMLSLFLLFGYDLDSTHTFWTFLFLFFSLLDQLICHVSWFSQPS